MSRQFQRPDADGGVRSPGASAPGVPPSAIGTLLRHRNAAHTPEYAYRSQTADLYLSDVLHRFLLVFGTRPPYSTSDKGCYDRALQRVLKRGRR